MSFRWKNVMANQAQGMDPVSAYNKEKRRCEAEKQQKQKNHLNNNQSNRGEENEPKTK